MRRMKASCFAGALMVVLSLSGIGGMWGFQPSLAQAAEEYEHIKIGLMRDIASLDPFGYPSLDRPEVNVQQCIFDHLLRRNEEGKIIGHLATDYKWLNDKTLRLTLRKNVTFHNGEKFTAADVKYTLEEMLKGTLSPGLLGIIRGIEKIVPVDDYTVDILTTGPFPTLPARLCVYTMMVSSKQRVNADPSIYGNNPIGTGPFKFVEWKKGDRIVLERNEKYWRGVPKVKRLTIFPIIDSSTRVSALKSGTVDIATDIPPSLAKELKGVPDFEVTASPSARTMFVMLRSDIPPFNDKRVRLAVNYAINRDEYIATVLEGYGLAINQPCPPYFFGHNPALKPYPYDPKKAKQLLAEAGYPKGFSVIMESMNVMEDRARPLSGYLKEIGIDCKIEVKEVKSLYAELFEKKTRPMLFWTWGNWSVLDIDGTIFDVLGCHKPEIGQGKWSTYCNPRIDEIINEMRTIDQDKRLRVAREANKIVHDDGAYIWLYAQYDIHVKKRGIPEFKARPDNTVWIGWVKGE